jgi:hypothetical protein
MTLVLSEGIMNDNPVGVSFKKSRLIPAMATSVKTWILELEIGDWRPVTWTWVYPVRTSIALMPLRFSKSVSAI